MERRREKLGWGEREKESKRGDKEDQEGGVREDRKQRGWRETPPQKRKKVTEQERKIVRTIVNMPNTSNERVPTMPH